MPRKPKPPPDPTAEPYKPRVGRRSNKILPTVEAQKKREKRPLRVLSPMQFRVLNGLFDPSYRTRADLAKATGVSEVTIGKWLMDSPAFLDEYRRRIERTGDDIVELNLSALKLAWRFYIEVLSDQSGKYGTDDKLKAAKVVLEINQPRIDAMNFNQINMVNTPAAAPVSSGAAVIPSVKRLEALGLDEQAATKADAVELAEIIHQLDAGAMQVIEGEIVEGGDRD